METTEFMRKHENWRELLSNAPYFISFDEDDNYVLLKYDQIRSDFSEPIDWLDVVFYVNYHMHLYNIQSDKAEKKWERIFGGEKWRQLNYLHEADMNSHTKGETK